MCGISGIYTIDEMAGRPEVASAVRRMTDLMLQRGPDGEGFWSDPGGHLQLGFRRLAIIDPSPAGHQPMVSGDGRSVIVFNGEIYNFQELRQELTLQGVRFRSRSDSEVLLEMLNQWGIKAISRLNGMFAFAWYNLEERTLILARDHAGIKPLYYFAHPSGKGLAFASQYNALLQTPWGIPGGVRLDVLRLLLQFHHIPPPYGLHENTFQLEPGHYLVVRPNGTTEKRMWWTLPRDPEPDLRGTDAVETMAEIIDRAVARQRISDVPLGTFLSGGVDSPLVTAVARRHIGSDLKAFTIGNPGWRQDEADAAATYAQKLDIHSHQVLQVDGDSALAAISEVITAQHEPFGDFSILPTLLLSRFARQEITVALSGDGGDELFFGYERPASLIRHGTAFRWPMPFRYLLYGLGKYGLAPPRNSMILYQSPGNYYLNANSRLRDHDLQQIAPELPSTPADFQLYTYDGPQDLRHLANYSRWVEFYGQMQRCLKKVDMASMHQSLEVRVPLLDREVIEGSVRLDPMDCMRNGTRKAVLRDLLSSYVPAEIIPQPKRGFSIPLAEWLRGPLRPVVEETLFSGTLVPDCFHSGGLKQYWHDHLTGRRDHKWGLWSLLALQWWMSAHAKSPQIAIRV